MLGDQEKLELEHPQLIRVADSKLLIPLTPMSNYNKHRYTANVDVLCAVYVPSIAHLSIPGRGIPHLGPYFWFLLYFFPPKRVFKFFLTQFEGLRQVCPDPVLEGYSPARFCSTGEKILLSPGPGSPCSEDRGQSYLRQTMFVILGSK